MKELYELNSIYEEFKGRIDALRGSL